MKELLNEAKGRVYICQVDDEGAARELEKKYHVSSKQYVDGGLQLKLLSGSRPEVKCTVCEATLEDAYIYITSRENQGGKKMNLPIGRKGDTLFIDGTK